MSEIDRQVDYTSAKEQLYKDGADRTSIPTDRADLQKEIRLLQKEIPKLELQAKTIRKEEQQANLQNRLDAGDKAGARALRNIIVAEETSEMFRQIQCMKGYEEKGVRQVDVPTSGDYTDCKNYTGTWKTLDDPTEIDTALRVRNRHHFGQAKGSFPTSAAFTEKVDWSATTEAADQILNGEDPFGTDTAVDDLSREMLAYFAYKTTPDVIEASLTTEEFVGKMKVWNEVTSTSPSGMHLGHHKSIVREIKETGPKSQRGTTRTIQSQSHLPPSQHSENHQVDHNEEQGDPLFATQNESFNSCSANNANGPPTNAINPEEDRTTAEDQRIELLSYQMRILQYAIKHQYSFERWRKIVNAMLLKETGDYRLHRLRVIHLYEADLNLLLGTKWRNLVHHAIDNNLFNPYQFGGLPGRDAHSPAFLEVLQWETSKASRRALLRVDLL